MQTNTEFENQKLNTVLASESQGDAELARRLSGATISAKRLFQKRIGCTVHTVTVTLPNGEVLKSKVVDGHGDFYLHTAAKLIGFEDGYILSRAWPRLLGIEVEVTDVERKRDL